MLERIKNFWKEYEYRIILLIGFILVSGIAFQAGIINGQKIKENPLIIEKPIEIVTTNENSQKAPEGQNLTTEAKNSSVSANASSEKISNHKQNCAFVGSKNSNKYHLPTCRWAKNIKPENLVCFSSEDEAKSKGYLPDKNCIK